jgi:DNA-binding GntR family transcriptional regulator
VRDETFLADVKISRRSTVDELAETLRERILAGEIPPGAALRESSIAQTVGVSRNTVREAIFALAAEGLIRHISHRGFFVVKLSPEDVADLYRVRRLIELGALDALSAGDSEALQDVDSALDHLRRAATENDAADAYEADLEIHRALVATLGSTRLDAIFAGLLVELRLAIIVMDTLSDFPELVTEHERLIQMIRAGDRPAAGELLKKHLADAERLLVAAVEAHDEGLSA